MDCYKNKFSCLNYSCTNYYYLHCNSHPLFTVDVDSHFSVFVVVEINIIGEYYCSIITFSSLGSDMISGNKAHVSPFLTSNTGGVSKKS